MMMNTATKRKSAKKKSAIKKLEPVERTITYQRVEVCGVVIEDDQLELLDALNDADGLFTAIVPDDTEFAEQLKRAGLADHNIRGGWYGTDKLKDMWSDIQAAFY